MRTLLLALVLLSGSASAAWMGPGFQEPDTSFDREPARMFPDPSDAEGSDRGPVYFSGFATSEPLVVNPNVGLSGSRIDAPLVRYRALLGAWKDCDRDGYIGHAEGALQEYRAELLALDASVCPEGSPHNDGHWVHELLAIGWVDPCEKRSVEYQQAYCDDVGAYVENKFVLYSDGSAVWADFGAPGAAPEGACGLAPQPRGTTASTGGLVRALDCRFGATGAPVPDVEAPLTLFGDPADGRVGLLRSGSGRPAATATDCSSGTPVEDPLGIGSVSQADPSGGKLTGPIAIPLGRRTVFADHDGDSSTPGVLKLSYADADGHVAVVPATTAPSVDQGGSAWDALVHAVDGVRLGAGENAPLVQRTTPGGPVLVVAYDSDCDARTRNAAEQAYLGDLVESDAAGGATGARTRNDVVLRFEDGYRSWHASMDAFIGPSAPTDVGVLATRSVHQGPLWSALQSSARDPSPLTRGDLTPAGARYITFYADIGDIRIENPALPAAAGGIYGQEACQGATSGVHNEWQCDARLWWRDAGGHDVMPRFAEGAPLARTPGEPYDLRDVDCTDGALARGAPVWIGLSPLSAEGTCRE